MPRPKIWTGDRLSELNKLAKEGLNYRELAAYYNVTPQRIGQVIKQYNITPPQVNAYKWRGQKLRTFSNLRTLGYTRKQLAEYFGVSVSAIGNVIDRQAVDRSDYHKATCAELEVIRFERARGRSVTQIAIKLGGHWTTRKVQNTVNYYTRRALAGDGPWAGRIPRRDKT